MFWNNILDLCAERGISPNALCSAIGLSNATATHWKKGSIPHGTTLKKIADYFNVSPDYLLGRTNVHNEQKEKPSANNDEGILDVPNLTPAQAELVRLFDSAPEHLRLAALAVLRAAESSAQAQDDDTPKK